MRSIKGTILLGIFSQAVVLVAKVVLNQLFWSRSSLIPFSGIEAAVIFVVGALIDFAVGYWFVRYRDNIAPYGNSRAVVSGSLVATTARLIGVLIGILILELFVFDTSIFQYSPEGIQRRVFLLNVAIFAFEPICSGGLTSVIFGGLGGGVSNSIARASEKTAVL